MNSQAQRQQVEALTKSKSAEGRNNRSDCQLSFKARCNATKVPVELHVYYGAIDDIEVDAIIDMTDLCSEHATTDSHVDIAKYADTIHASQTLEYM